MADFPAGHPTSRELALCLYLESTGEEQAALRLRLLAGGWTAVVELARHLRLLPALATAAAAKGLTAGIPKLRDEGTISVSAALEDALTNHASRAGTLRGRLVEALDALAARQIHPVLLKGARALWLGTPAWRSLRDLDLLVSQPSTAAAVNAILDTGYHPNADFDAPGGWHHGAELYRDDLPGWIEIHERAGVRRMEFILPTSSLDSAAHFHAAADGKQARVLPPAEQILHCLTHHHIGHRGDYYGEIDFKGLYEFASDVAVLDAEGRQALLHAAARHPRLMAALDLWLAAAADTFRLRIAAPLELAADAERQWRYAVSRVMERARESRPPRRFEGLAREVAMSLDRRRLKKIYGGVSTAGRAILRLRALRALVARAAIGD